MRTGSSAAMKSSCSCAAAGSAHSTTCTDRRCFAARNDDMRTARVGFGLVAEAWGKKRSVVWGTRHVWVGAAAFSFLPEL